MRAKMEEWFRSCSSEHIVQGVPVPGGILGATWRGMGVLLHALLFHQDSSAFICPMYRTGVACQILFDK